MGHVMNCASGARVKLRLGRSVGATIREEIRVLPGQAARLKQVALDSDIEQLRLRAFVGFAYGNFLRRDSAAHAACRIIQIPGKNCLRGADDDASRLQLGFHAVSAEVAFGGGVEIGIDVEGVIGAGLHATLAADTSLIVKIDDSVGASV